MHLYFCTQLLESTGNGSLFQNVVTACDPRMAEEGRESPKSRPLLPAEIFHEIFQVVQDLVVKF